MSEDTLMRIRIAMMNLCLAVLLPLSAASKPPVAAACEVLVPDTVTPGVDFEVTVARSPSYPGQWFSPTVTVEVVAPVIATVLGPNSWSQTVTQTFLGLGGSNDATATFFIPAGLSVDMAGGLNVFATVSEPINKNKSRVSYCEAVIGFAP
jgi:hypothetical protein